MKKIVVFYYTQSGQVLNIMHNICQPIVEAGDEVIYKEIVPEITDEPNYDAVLAAAAEATSTACCGSCH